MELIITRPDWTEAGYLECNSVDIENGGQNDFEIMLGIRNYNADIHRNGSLIYVPGTEWGGIIKTIHPSGNALYLGGPTWRGRLDKSIVVPDEGYDYYAVSGDANAVIGQVLARQGLTGLFRAPDVPAGITFSSQVFPRYTSVLQGLNSILAKKDARLRFRYIRGPANGIGYVEVSAARIRDLSNQIEINNDMQVNYDIEQRYFTVNHLICLGKGQLKDRLRVDLYVNQYGRIVDTMYFTGIDEVAEVYELSNEETVENLKSQGERKLKELLQSSTIKASFSSDRIEVDIGDIVSGRERITGIKVRVPVIRKILTIKNGAETMDYKLKGE